MKETVFFWHEYEENGYLSQWYHAPFFVEGIEYKNAEQYMMAKKALLFGDFSTYELIMGETNPAFIKAYGKRVSPFDGNVWGKAVEEVLYNANMAKFSQNPDLKKALLNTGDAILAEASPNDSIYGIGLAADDQDAKEIYKWKGQNKLGVVLMKVRKAIQDS